MNIPTNPLKGEPVISKITEIIRFIRASRITSVVGGHLRETPNGTVLTIKPGSGGGSSSASGPFLLSTSTIDGDLTWKVSQNKSSVMDGTNGAAIDLGPAGVDWGGGSIKFGIPTTITATKFIVLEADVDADLVITHWTLAAVDEADADEVRFTTTPPIYQDKIRLLIGKVTVDTGATPPTAIASQAVFSAQRISHGLLNGMAVKALDSAPIQVNNL